MKVPLCLEDPFRWWCRKSKREE